MASANIVDELYVEKPEGPRLIAVECKLCGYVDFPPQHYGCRQCGGYGDDLVDTEIPTPGKIVTSAEVHHFPGEKYELPFTVAVVKLDSGPVTRVTMKSSGALKPGTEVIGVVVDTDGVKELRFDTKDATSA